uniref:Uncharacterized protein n=1 Tax=viral metagenome TaxID=1070528 RepID=A0A6M3IG25_9ZZZZ
MPYAVRKQGEKWITYNSDTGDVKGKHDSKEKANKQLRLLYMVKHGETSRS